MSKESGATISISLSKGEFKSIIRDAVEEVLAPALRPSQETLVTISEAAKLLKTTEKNIYSKIYRGQLKAIKVPGFPKRVRVAPELLGAR